jgi:flagellar export protein FliJ
MARRFRFSLEPVRRLRELREAEERRVYGEANRAVEETRLRMEARREERREIQEAVRGQFEAGAPFRECLESYRYIYATDRRLASEARELRGLESTRQEKLAHYLRARREREALDLLKERQAGEHAAQVAREEQAVLDELGVQARRRRMRDGED